MLSKCYGVNSYKPNEDDIKVAIGMRANFDLVATRIFKFPKTPYASLPQATLAVSMWAFV